MAALETVSAEDPAKRVVCVAPVNLAEECWHRLSQCLGNQLFEELDELRDAALATLDSIKPTNLFSYLCP